MHYFFEGDEAFLHPGGGEVNRFFIACGSVVLFAFAFMLGRLVTASIKAEGQQSSSIEEHTLSDDPPTFAHPKMNRAITHRVQLKFEIAEQFQVGFSRQDGVIDVFEQRLREVEVSPKLRLEAYRIDFYCGSCHHWSEKFTQVDLVTAPSVIVIPLDPDLLDQLEEECEELEPTSKGIKI